ncbi:MAG TPA: hypothetical protein VFN13_10760 [Rudaea sp.]|nr:hypothetical protein [Rudaea sp.]
MNSKRARPRLGARRILSVLSAFALFGLTTLPWSDSSAQTTAPTIDFHVISAAGKTLHNSCYHLSGTVGQAAPGYSSASSGDYWLDAGFWATAATQSPDQIFFHGFEEC